MEAETRPTPRGFRIESPAFNVNKLESKFAVERRDTRFVGGDYVRIPLQKFAETVTGCFTVFAQQHVLWRGPQGRRSAGRCGAI